MNKYFQFLKNLTFASFNISLLGTVKRCRMDVSFLKAKSHVIRLLSIYLYEMGSRKLYNILSQSLYHSSYWK